jgi:hypothetical protein
MGRTVFSAEKVPVEAPGEPRQPLLGDRAEGDPRLVEYDVGTALSGDHGQRRAGGPDREAPLPSGARGQGGLVDQVKRWPGVHLPSRSSKLPRNNGPLLA